MSDKYIQKKSDKTGCQHPFLKNNKKVVYLISLLILGLIFNFTLAIFGCGVIEEHEKENQYLSEVVYIMGALAEDSNFYKEVCSDVASGDMSLSEHKEITSKLIEEINSFYDQYLKLDTPKKLEVSNDLLGKSLEHYSNSCEYLQKYVDTDDNTDMAKYFKEATLEWDQGDRYWLKTKDELQRFLKSEGEKYQKFLEFLK